MPRTLARPVIDPRRVHEALLKTLALMDFFVAATAISGGVMMLLRPRGADAFVPAAWLEGSPFLDAVVPGLALLVAVGGTSLAAAVYALRRTEHAPLGSVGSAAVLLAFLTVELTVVPGVHRLQLLYLALAGAVVLVAALAGARPAQLVPAVRSRLAAHPVGAFVAVVFTTTWVPHVPQWAEVTGHMTRLPGWATAVGMAAMLIGGPVGAAALVLASTEGRRGLAAWGRSLIRWRVSWKWYAVAILPYPIIAALSIVGADLVRGDPSHLPVYFEARVAEMAAGLGASGTSLGLLLPLLVVYGLLVVPLFEEPGWRGFALPRLQQTYGPITAAVALGATWAFWHLPNFFIPGSPHYGMPFSGFLIEVVGLSVLMTWIFNATRGSVLVAMLVHGSIILASVFLPAGLPVATHDLLAFWISVVLGAVAVVALVTVVGPRLGQRTAEPPAS